MQLRCQIDSFPFDEGYLPSSSHDSMFRRLPFLLECRTEDPVIRQKLLPEARVLLHEYYAKGGYGSTPLGEGEYATRQGDDVFTMLHRVMEEAGKTWEQSDVLEIGSSYGYVLHRARQAGARSVIGIEPGDEGVVGSQKYDVPIIQDFFPTSKFDQDIDVIFTHCVLEHIEELTAFVQSMVERLRPGGLLCIAVPDCEYKLRIGDISIISHQHINYFTADSLRFVLEEADLERVSVVSSETRSILYAWAIKPLGIVSGSDMEFSRGLGTFLDFVSVYEKNIQSLQSAIVDAEREGQTIGYYGISPVLRGLLEFRDREPRLFDSDASKHGKRISSSSLPIESPDQLLREPVDRLFICPIDYDREIHSFLMDSGFPMDRVVSIKNLYEHNAGYAYRSSRES